MTDDPQDLKVENALLRGCLFLTARALKDYRDSKHTKVDDEMLQLAVPPSLPERADAALERANRILRDEQKGRTP